MISHRPGDTQAPPNEPTTPIRNKLNNSLKHHTMKSSCHIILSAAVLVTASLPPALSAQTPAPAAPPAAESYPGLREIERKVLQKQYESALQEMFAAEKAMRMYPTPDEAQMRNFRHSKEWVEQIKAQLAALEPGNNPKVAALTKKLDAIRIPKVDFETCTLSEVLDFLRLRGKELDPDKTGVNLVLMDKENKATVTLRLENVTLHTVLKTAAEQAGLTLDIGDEIVVLRKPTGNPAIPEEDDVAFFEKKISEEDHRREAEGRVSGPRPVLLGHRQAVGDSRDRLERGG